MIKNIIGLCFFCVFCINKVHANEDSKSENIAIIVGKPYKVKDSPNTGHYDKVSISSKYIAYFKDYKVVLGVLENKRTLK